MAIKLIHVSDIHFGSGESHGRINPKTGLNVRFEDFARALSRVVDFTLEKDADIFLFSGDAYRNATPEPIYQKTFAQQLKRLSDFGIPTILLVGNHDQILKSGTSHSMSVFESLGVPGVTVIENPQFLKLETKRGPVQLIGMPHVTRHLLMTHEKYASLGASEIDQVLVRLVSEILKNYYSQLDPAIPAIATAHIMLDTARAGAEQDLLVGYSMTFPLGLFIDSRLDYVALGHVHGHQILNPQNPLIAYAGSLERVDFGEEKEDKGFIEADIERGNCSIKFHSIDPRPFTTISEDLCQSPSPTEQLIKAACNKAKDGSVFRIKYRIQQSRLAEVDEDRISAEIPQVLSLRFKPELVFTERPRRMPEINESAVLSPLTALDKFLTETAPDNKSKLMEKAATLIAKFHAGKLGPETINAKNPVKDQDSI